MNSNMKILSRAALDAAIASKSRDDVWYEISWTLIWLMNCYGGGHLSDEHALFLDSRDRTPINHLLDRCYTEGVIPR